MTEPNRPIAEPVELTAADGVILRGQAWSNESHWAILFHEAGRDLDAWTPLLPALFARGYSVLTLDLRGHGLSFGDWNPDQIALDLNAALDFVRGRGAATIAFIGAGESALPALTESLARSFLALALFSAGPLGSHAVHTLRGEGVPKLFVVGTRDEGGNQLAEKLRNRSIGWSMLLRLPTDETGTALLGGPWARHVEEQVVAFLEEQRFRGVTVERPNPAAAEALFRRMFGA